MKNRVTFAVIIAAVAMLFSLPAFGATVFTVKHRPRLHYTPNSPVRIGVSINGRVLSESRMPTWWFEVTDDHGRFMLLPPEIFGKLCWDMAKNDALSLLGHAAPKP